MMAKGKFSHFHSKSFDAKTAPSFLLSFLQLFTAKFTREEFENRRKLFSQRTKQDIKLTESGRVMALVKLLADGRKSNLSLTEYFAYLSCPNDS